MSLCFAIATGFGFYSLVTSPETPLPDSWNPVRPLQISAPVNMMTDLKLRITASGNASCLAALEQGDVGYVSLPDLEPAPNCHIRNRVILTSVGDAKISPLQTTCETALRLAMWERHGIQSVAQKHFATDVAEILHIGSYNCRAIRGYKNLMSTHASASSVDIQGFVLRDGQTIDLREDWPKDDAKSSFLKEVRDTSCKWFQTTLGPEYNTLHADHFHLQSRGWGTCR